MYRELTTFAVHAIVMSDALGDNSDVAGLGRFVADTRVLSRYELRLAGDESILLRLSPAKSTETHVDATNAAFDGDPAQPSRMLTRPWTGDLTP